MGRQYIAFCDDGHDFFEFEFWSYHRAGSKKNLEDAREQYARGHKNRKYTIKSVILNKGMK